VWIRVEFVVDTVPLGAGFSFEYFDVLLPITIPPTIHMHSAPNIITIIVNIIISRRHAHLHGTKVYPKVSGLAACSENCKWYSSLPLDEVVSLLCESV
jgi:hypothetical protein